MIMEIIGIIASVIILMFWIPGVPGGQWEGLTYILDWPTLICMLIIILPILLKEGVGKDFLRAFKLLKKEYKCSFSELRHSLDVVEMMQKQILCAGCIVSFQGTFAMLYHLSDLSSIGPNLSIALLSILYTGMFELLMLPLQIEAKRRIVDYIEQEQDTEESEKELDAEKI